MGKTSKTVQWKLDKMIEYYQLGMSAKKAAKKVNSSPQVCLRELKKRGVGTREQVTYIKTPQNILNKIVDNYMKGMSAEKSAGQFGLSSSVCQNELKRRGIKTRPSGTYQSPSHKNKDRMIKKYLSGMTAEKAGKFIGVTSTTCLKELKRRGISSRESASYRRISVDDDYFENINTEKKAYWLGFITADGCITNGNVLHFTLKQSDKEHLTKFLKEVKYAGMVKDYFTTNGHWVCKVSISSKKIYTDLMKYGITERKSLTIKPYKFNNSKLEIAYWRGIVDGDGHVLKNTSVTTATGYAYEIGLTGTLFIIHGFMNFIENNNIDIEDKKPRKNGNVWVIRFRKFKTVFLLTKLLYGDASIYLNRKYKMYKEIANK